MGRSGSNRNSRSSGPASASSPMPLPKGQRKDIMGYVPSLDVAKEWETVSVLNNQERQPTLLVCNQDTGEKCVLKWRKYSPLKKLPPFRERWVQLMLDLSNEDDAPEASMRVCRVYKWENRIYTLNEKVDGRTGTELMECPLKNHEASRKFAAAFCYLLCVALDELHSFGYAHLDVKFDNLVLEEGKKNGQRTSGLLKLIDLDTLHRPGHDDFDFVCGTDQFIAPETYRGEPCFNSDMFAVGAIAFVITTGSCPFPDDIFTDEPGENNVGHEKMEQIADRVEKLAPRVFKPLSASEKAAVGPDGVDFVQSCFEPDPRKRLTPLKALDHPFLAITWPTPIRDKIATIRKKNELRRASESRPGNRQAPVISE